jgi:hypothetical protein
MSLIIDTFCAYYWNNLTFDWSSFCLRYIKNDSTDFDPGYAIWSWYAEVTLPVCWRYAPSTLMLRSQYAEGTLPACWGYAPSTLRLCSQYAPSMMRLRSQHAEVTLPVRYGYTVGMLPWSWYAEHMLLVRSQHATTILLQIPLRSTYVLSLCCPDLICIIYAPNTLHSSFA